MKIKVIAKPLSNKIEPASAVISFKDGQFQVASNQTALYEEIVDALANRYFIQGKGFPIFKKNKEVFAIDPQTGRLILEGFVDLDASEDEVLNAVKDNFLIGEQYQVDKIE